MIPNVIYQNQNSAKLHLTFCLFLDSQKTMCTNTTYIPAELQMHILVKSLAALIHATSNMHTHAPDDTVLMFRTCYNSNCSTISPFTFQSLKVTLRTTGC
jgi:hypothetical protein